MFGLLLGLALLVVAVVWFQRQGHSRHNHGGSNGHHSGHGHRHSRGGGCH